MKSVKQGVDNMRFADKIMKLRDEQGISQKDLAKSMGVSRQTVYKWEADLSVPEIDKIKSLSQFFGVSCEELLNDSIPLPSTQSNCEDLENDIEIAPIEIEQPKINKKLSKKSILLIIIFSLIAIILTGAILLTVHLLKNAQEDNADNTVHICKSPTYKTNKVIVEPTCEESGKIEIICLQCGYTAERYTPMKTHVFEDNQCLICNKINATEGIEYAIDIETNTAYVKSIGTSREHDIVIDDTYNGYKVTKIANGAFKNSYVATVKIPDSVTVIGEYAFYNCIYLHKITFGSSVYNIGRYAFANCDKMEQLVIPSSVHMIWEGAFESTEIDIVVIGSNVKLIGSRAFNNSKVERFEFTSYGKWKLSNPQNNNKTEIDILPHMDNISYLSEYNYWNWTKE